MGRLAALICAFSAAAILGTLTAGAQPPITRCLIISGTGDALIRDRAAERAQDALQDAIDKWRAEYGVQSFEQTASRPEPQPYWRSSVDPDLYYQPDEVTDQVYTICWKGVISPAVCTAGARVCW